MEQPFSSHSDIAPDGCSFDMNYRHILFDIDGTMTDSEQAVRRALAMLLTEEFGSSPLPDDIVFSFGVPGVDTLRDMGFRDPERADRRWAELTLALYDTVKLFPGIADTVETLHRRGFTLGIVTSKNRSEYESEFASRFALSSLFDDYICADDTTEHKPLPGPILEYIRRHDADPGSILFVGDTIHDASCARGSGVAFALAAWGNKNAVAIPADYRPMSPADLPAIAGEDPEVPRQNPKHSI